MTFDEKRQFQKELLNIQAWHDAGLTGEGTVIMNAEFDAEHGASTRNIFEYLSSDATIISQSISCSKNNDEAFWYVYDKENDERVPLEDYLIEHKVDFVSASLASSSMTKSTIDSPETKELIRISEETGVIFFNSAGNEGNDGMTTKFPFDACISIGAVLRNARTGKVSRARYSSIGDELDFCSFTFGYSGTSFSCPATVAMCALLKQKFGKMSFDELYFLLQDISVDIDEEGFDINTGWGYPVLPNLDYEFPFKVNEDESVEEIIEEIIEEVEEEVGDMSLIMPVGESIITIARQKNIDSGEFELYNGVIISSGYGRRNSGDGFHDGIDLLPINPWVAGDEIVAAHKGNIAKVSSSSGYGNYIIIDGDGYSTLYAHLDSVAVREGDLVAQGEHIGNMGMTGATAVHLHFEYRDRTYAGHEAEYWNTHSKNGGDEFYSSQTPLNYIDEIEISIPSEDVIMELNNLIDSLSTLREDLNNVQEQVTTIDNGIEDIVDSIHIIMNKL